MKAFLVALGIAATIAAIVVAVFVIRWVTANPRGQLQAREQILSGSNRIQAYEHFYNLCAAVQGDEAQLDALYNERKVADGDDRARVEANITGVSAQRQRSIFNYNADARKDYTIGQFRSIDLPYQLDETAYPEGGHTQC